MKSRFMPTIRLDIVFTEPFFFNIISIIFSTTGDIERDGDNDESVGMNRRFWNEMGGVEDVSSKENAFVSLPINYLFVTLI